MNCSIKLPAFPQQLFAENLQITANIYSYRVSPTALIKFRILVTTLCNCPNICCNCLRLNSILLVTVERKVVGRCAKIR